jgi:hypothetical protein
MSPPPPDLVKLVRKGVKGLSVIELDEVIEACLVELKERRKHRLAAEKRSKVKGCLRLFLSALLRRCPLGRFSKSTRI